MLYSLTLGYLSGYAHQRRNHSSASGVVRAGSAGYTRRDTDIVFPDLYKTDRFTACFDTFGAAVDHIADVQARVQSLTNAVASASALFLANGGNPIDTVISEEVP